jgi:hypothetical protein
MVTSGLFFANHKKSSGFVARSEIFETKNAKVTAKRPALDEAKDRLSRNAVITRRNLGVNRVFFIELRAGVLF